MANSSSKKIILAFNAEQEAYLSSLLPKGVSLNAESLKAIIGQFCDLPKDAQAGRPKGSKNKSTNKGELKNGK